MILRLTHSHVATRLADGLLALLMFGLPVEGADKPIRLRNRQIDTANIPSVAGRQQGLARHASEHQAGLRWIQLTGPLEPQWRAELAALGVDLLHYVPEDAFLARFKGVDPAELHSLEYVRWIGTVGAADKLMPGLGATGDETVRILVSDDADPTGIGNARSMLARVERESRARFGTVLEGTIPAARLPALGRVGFSPVD